VKFKRLIWGPQTDTRDGGMNPKDPTAVEIISLVLRNFFKFFRKRSKTVFIIKGWKFKEEAMHKTLLQLFEPPFLENLAQTCNRAKLSTQATTTSIDNDLISQWKWTSQWKNREKRSFIVSIDGPFNDQLVFQGRIIGSNILNTKEILGTVLSIFNAYRFLFDGESEAFEETFENYSAAVIKNHTGMSLIKFLDISLLGGKYLKSDRKKRNRKARRLKRKEKRERKQRRLEARKAYRKIRDDKTQQYRKSQLEEKEARISNSSKEPEKLIVLGSRSKSYSQNSEEQIHQDTEKVILENTIAPNKITSEEMIESHIYHRQAKEDQIFSAII
jgi:hypothetical protein